MSQEILKHYNPQFQQTFEQDVDAIVRLPTSNCTETLAWDRSTPEDCSACVKVSNILLNKQTENKKPTQL